MDDASDRVKSGGWRIAFVVSVMGAGVVVVLGLTLFERRADPVYAVASYQVVLASVGAIAALCGLAGLLLIRRYDLAALAAVATGLLVAGWAALLSIGILLILLASIPIWLLAKRLSQTSDWLAVLTGAGVGMGLLLLTWVAIQPPLVACGESGATVSIPSQYDAVSGGATRDGDREVGWAEFDGNSLSYECQGGELVTFELSRNSG